LGLWQLRSLPVQFLSLPITVEADELACVFDSNRLDWNISSTTKDK
jgi:hypothetical protein